MAQNVFFSPRRNFPGKLTSLRVGIDALLARELKDNEIYFSFKLWSAQ